MSDNYHFDPYITTMIVLLIYLPDRSSTHLFSPLKYSNKMSKSLAWTTTSKRNFLKQESSHIKYITGSYHILHPLEKYFNRFHPKGNTGNIIMKNEISSFAGSSGNISTQGDTHWSHFQCKELLATCPPTGGYWIRSHPDEGPEGILIQKEVRETFSS